MTRRERRILNRYDRAVDAFKRRFAAGEMPTWAEQAEMNEARRELSAVETKTTASNPPKRTDMRDDSHTSRAARGGRT
jgi:hypothetical protein